MAAPFRVCLWVPLDLPSLFCKPGQSHHCLYWVRDREPLKTRTSTDQQKRSVYECMKCQMTFITANWGPVAFDETTTFLCGDTHGYGQQRMSIELAYACDGDPDIVVVPLSRRVELLAWLDGFRAGSGD